jgi:23S rRNA (cytidine1920-2'-O)/16S rRNA (cytidine1409-2'-O)-methyltransferase
MTCIAPCRRSSKTAATEPARLDAELVRRGLAPSRAEAKRAIENGRVSVAGAVSVKPQTLVARDAFIRVEGGVRRFASRGGDKLDGALARLDVTVRGRKWLDAGASTGGFTDRLLAGGAEAVAAVDVGYGQLDWRLRTDERVFVLERTNIRTLQPSDLPFVPEAVAADLSFISLVVVLPALRRVAAPDADFVLMVKPQFEVGRDAVGRGGVVRDPELWMSAVRKVVHAAGGLGLGLVAVVPSAVPGPKGNREFFVHLRQRAAAGDEAISVAVAEASP